MLPKSERNLVTVRELLSLTHPRLLSVVKMRVQAARQRDEQFYNENSIAVDTLLRAMSGAGTRFGGVLAANRQPLSLDAAE